MATVNPNTVQKFLATVSDIIAKKINDNPALRLPIPANIAKIFYKYATSDVLSVDEATTMLERQHDLLSTNFITDRDVALDVFLNNTKTDQNQNNFISKNFDYSITHNIIIPYKTNPENPDSETELYYFNIDELNRVLSYPGELSAMFEKIEIKNKSKDAFTARSNYHVTMHIAFNYFEDLSDAVVIARKVGDPNTTKNIPILSILYKYFRLPNTAVGSALKDISDRDPDGIYLNQVLKFENKNYFKNVTNNISHELHRTFRLTYYKHEFEVFKSDDPFTKDFENKLTIQFISYEADLASKPGKDKNLPTVTDNIYLMLNPAAVDILDTGNIYSYTWRTRVFKEDYRNSFTYIREINDTLSALRTQLNCKILYENKKTINAADTADYAAYAGVDLTKVREKISKLTEVLTTAKYEIQRALINSILNQSTFYSINTEYEVLGDYNRLDILYDMWKNFSTIGAITSTVGTTTVAATFIPKTPVSMTVSALAGLGLYGGQLYAQSALGHYTSIDRTPSDLNLIRQRIKGQVNDIKKLSNSEVTDLFQTAHVRLNGVNNPPPGSKPSTNPLTATRVAEIDDAFEFTTSGKQKRREREKKTLEMAGLINSEDASDPNQLTTKIDIPFILFGDILKILNITEPNSILYIGGKLIDNFSFIPSRQYSYVNFFDYPISANLYFKFLKNFILDVDRDLNYSSELFLRDAYDNLLKKTIMRSDGATQSIYKNYLPANLQMSMSTHVDASALQALNSLLGTNVDVDDPGFFTALKRLLAQSKNIQYKIGPSPRLKTLYFLASDEELDRYDFYSKFREWANNLNATATPENIIQNSNLCSYEFQNYIVGEHLLPCILLRSTANDETILKKKNVSFTRIDNPNLQTGNIIDNASFMRLPYQFKSQFHIYLSFFIDIGSLIFISPPAGRRGADDNKYGFAGLYVIKEADFEYYFQRFKGDDISLPNEESNYYLGGYLVCYGDGQSPIKTEEVRGGIRSDCADPILANTTPAQANRYDALIRQISLN